MKIDIENPKVEGIVLAIVKRFSEINEAYWEAHIVNAKRVALNNVIIASTGYGVIKDEKIKTSTLRHYFKTIPARHSQKIENVQPEVFGLSNEYWLSYYIDGKIFDKKYVFVAESITDENLVQVPIMGDDGIVLM